MPDPTTPAAGTDPAVGGTPAEPTSLAAGGAPATVTPAAGAAPQLGADGKPVVPAGDPAKPGEGKPAAPAEIVYDFKAPDGMELDKAALGEFTTLAKELKLEPGTAQKLVDVAVSMQQRQIQEHTKLVDSWAAEVTTGKTADGKDLPEHLRVPGGDELPKTLAVCKKAMDLGPPELKQLLNDSGFGNHPAVVAFMYKVGKALSQDGFVAGGAPSAEATAQRLYDKSNMNR